LVNFNKLVKVNDLDAIEQDFPSDAEFTTRKAAHLLGRLLEQASQIAPEDLIEFEPAADQLLSRVDARTLVAMLLQSHMDRPPVDLDSLAEESQPSARPDEISGAPPPPGQGRKRRRRRRSGQREGR
jgi:hypothetical protein